MFFSLSVHPFGYPIALVIMIAFYGSELLSVSVRNTTRWLVPARSKARRR